MRIAIYPGSFDPPTLGHLDIVRRAARMFDRVVMAVGVNTSKQKFLSVDERLAALRACTEEIPNVEVSQFSGLLVDYARSIQASCIVRGLRAVSDFDYEFQISIANNRLAPDLETMMLMTSWEYGFISSSVVREVSLLGGDVSTFVPEPVLELLNRRRNS